jgi:hypothetical protein
VQNFRSITGAAGARHALLVAALALFGLLSMHGWGTHADMHPETSHNAAHAPALMGAGSHHAGTPGSATVDGNDDAGCDDCSGFESGSGMGLIALCLAVLGAFVLALVLLLLRRGVRLLRAPEPVWRTIALLSRDRDPPDLLRLCVITC